MKKTITLLISLVLCVTLLAGCGCKHETWNEADCLNPKTCAECGETEGEVLPHSWLDATCTVPKTCSGCGLTEGEVLPHSWLDATCTAPKTCSDCGLTEGELGEHVYGEWEILGVEARQVCEICDAEGETRQTTADEQKAYMCQQMVGTWVIEFVYWNNEAYLFEDLYNGEAPYIEVTGEGDGAFCLYLNNEEWFKAENLNTDMYYYGYDGDNGMQTYAADLDSIDGYRNGIVYSSTEDGTVYFMFILDETESWFFVKE